MIIFVPSKAGSIQHLFQKKIPIVLLCFQTTGRLCLKNVLCLESVGHELRVAFRYGAYVFNCVDRGLQPFSTRMIKKYIRSIDFL